MRRRVRPGPSPSAIFGTVKGAPTAFVAPEGDRHERWAAWVVWEEAFRRFEHMHPELQEACDEVFGASIPEIPNRPFDPSEI